MYDKKKWFGGMIYVKDFKNMVMMKKFEWKIILKLKLF